MSDFETTATIEIEIAEQSLRDARDDIESALGDVSVSVSAGGGGRPAEMRSDGGRSGRQRRRARQQHRWARQDNDHIEDILEILEGLETGGDGGGLFGQLLGGAGDIGGALAGALPAGIGAAVGSAAGPAIADAVSDSEVGVDAEEADDTITVTKPEWTPLEATEPDWVPLPVEEPNGGIDIPLPGPGDLPTLSFDSPPTVGVDEPGPLPISDDNLPLPVEDVDPISVTVEHTRRGPTSPRVGPPTGDSDDGVGGVNIGGDSGITLGPGGVNIGGETGITLGEDPRGATRSPQSDVDIVAETRVDPTININVDTTRLVDDITREFDSAIADVRRELEREIQQVADDLNDLEREITRGR